MYTQALPLVGQLMGENEALYEASRLPTVTVFADVDFGKNAKGYEYVANRARKAAKEFSGRVLVNIADKDHYSWMLEEFGLQPLPGRQDIGVGLAHGKMRYAMDSAFSVDNLKAFVTAFKAGSLTGIEAKPKAVRLIN